MICLHQNGVPLWVNPDHIVKMRPERFNSFKTLMVLTAPGSEYIDENPDQILDLIRQYHDLH